MLYPWTRLFADTVDNSVDDAGVGAQDLQEQIFALQGGKESISRDRHGLLMPPYPEAVEWLEDYYVTGRRLPGSAALLGRNGKQGSRSSARSPSGQSNVQQSTSPSSTSPDIAPNNEPSVWSNMLARASEAQDQVKSVRCTDVQDQPVQKTNLLIVPVGDDWSADNWLTHPASATFDIIALHHGDDSNFTCPQCLSVVSKKGPKWRLYYEFTATQEWDQLALQYDYIMLPDDDLKMDTCAINKVFSVMRDYDLLLAQPSVCERLGAPGTWRPELHQRPQWLLRYSTFVEVMAPTFRMDFFHHVARRTFSKYWTYVGWGLDSVWPALLHYPRDRIAIIDAVCMVHVPGQGGLGTANKEHSIYAPGLSPYTAKQEELIVFSAFNYSADTTDSLGEPFMSSRILGGVPNVAVVKAMAETAGESVTPSQLMAIFAASPGDGNDGDKNTKIGDNYMNRFNGFWKIFRSNQSANKPEISQPWLSKEENVESMERGQLSVHKRRFVWHWCALTLIVIACLAYLGSQNCFRTQKQHRRSPGSGVQAALESSIDWRGGGSGKLRRKGSTIDAEMVKKGGGSEGGWV